MNDNDDLEVDELTITHSLRPLTPQEEQIRQTCQRRHTMCNCGACSQCVERKQRQLEANKERQAALHIASRAPLGLDQDLYEQAFGELPYNNDYDEAEQWEMFKKATLILMSGDTENV